MEEKSSVVVAIKMIIFENRSTIMRLALNTFDSGNGPMRSIEMCSRNGRDCVRVERVVWFISMNLGSLTGSQPSI